MKQKKILILLNPIFYNKAQNDVKAFIYVFCPFVKKIQHGYKRGLKVAFTLAEVLITLSIVGVVAALILPNLISKINDRVAQNQSAVFSAKLTKGLNLTKTAGDLNNTYTSTYDFLVNGLGKNLKMVKICDSENIRDCVPYDKIKIMKNGGGENTINVKDIKTASMLKLKEPYEDTAAFTLADGTFAIVSYNKSCIVDDGEADTTINTCLAGIYDINGTRKPNKFGFKIEKINDESVTSYVNDIRSFNGASIFGTGCYSTIDKLCIVNAAVKANNDMLPLITMVDSGYTSIPKIKDENGNDTSMNDYWQLANDYCSKVAGGSLPDPAQLETIADLLYDQKVNKSNSIYIYNRLDNVDWDTSKNKDAIISALGIESTVTSFHLWASIPHDSVYSNFRFLNKNNTGYGYSGNGKRDYNNKRAICIKN